jgi:arabinofuranosyltransferase
MYLTIILAALISIGIGFTKKITFYTEYIFLFFILVLAVFHIYAYNTDAEDAYIAYRYSQNFANGNGLVFNPGEHVEGYSDFIWVVLLGLLNKITTISLPALGRNLGLLFSLITIILTYTTAKKLTNDNKKLALLSILILACSGSFIAYALSGLEAPLFAVFIILIFNLIIAEKWFATGLIIGLATMTRPEGILMSVPLIISLLTKSGVSAKHKFDFFLKILLGILILISPWTIWRLSYYGYLIPNAMAAKRGMNSIFQLKQGLSYFYDHWMKINAPLFIGIVALLILTIKKWKSFIVLFSALLVYSIFYVLIGGDWMPAYRLYSPLYPPMILLIVILLNNYFSNPAPFLKTAGFVFLFLASAIYILNISFNNVNMIPKVQMWKSQVNSLVQIGKWFKNNLPENTIVATFPNGAFSYYNELYTIDVAGLTDEHIARNGLRYSEGMAGHIAHDEYYILNRNPDIIAVMNGAGFEESPMSYVPEIYAEKYECVRFQFLDEKSVSYVNLLMKKTKTKAFIQLLSKENIISI